MYLTSTEQNQIAIIRLQKYSAYNILPNETKSALIEVFKLGMMEMNCMNMQERIFELKIELENINNKTL